MNTFTKLKASKSTLTKRSLVRGIGINDAWYTTQKYGVTCPVYSKWHSMLTRCYSSYWHAKHPTYIGCKADKEWLTFSYFAEWLESQEHWTDLQIDKDILFRGNKIYSRKTCLLVPQKINGLLNDHRNARGLLPIGVHQSKNNRFYAQCNNEGKQVGLGLFDDPQKAHTVYILYKSSIVKKSAMDLPDYIDVRLKPCLLRIAEEIKNGEYYKHCKITEKVII